jgi:hypothetical protein
VTWTQRTTLILALFSLAGATWLFLLSFRPIPRAPDPRTARRFLRSGSVLSLLWAVLLAATWYVETSRWFEGRLLARFAFLGAHLIAGALPVRWFLRSNRDMIEPSRRGPR